MTRRPFSYRRPGRVHRTVPVPGRPVRNWVEDQRRTDLLDTSQGLSDLARALGWLVAALSLWGDLALAFGARGSGGPGRVRAHHEPTGHRKRLRVDDGVDETAAETLAGIGEDLIEALAEGRGRRQETGTAVVLWHEDTSSSQQDESGRTRARPRVPKTRGHQGAGTEREHRRPRTRAGAAGRQPSPAVARREGGEETMDNDAREKVAAMTRSLRDCLTVLESKELHNVIQTSQVHGFPYSGPNVDMRTLKAAIADGEALLS